MKVRVTQGALAPSVYRLKSIGAAATVTMATVLLVLGAIATNAGEVELLPAGFALAAALMSTLGPAVVALAHMFGLGPRPRTVELSCKKGVVAGDGFELRAADVLGASTAALGNPAAPAAYLLSVETTGSVVPDALVLESLADLEEVRRALGVAHDGTRGLSWATGRPTRYWVALSVAIGSLVLAPLGLLAMWVLSLFARDGKPGASQVVLSPEGIRWWAQGEGHAVPYSDVETVTVAIGGLLLERRHGPVELIPLGSLPPAHRSFVCAQITSAADRAQRPPEASAGLDVLRRGKEGLRQWLVRVDALQGAGYRSAGVDRADLWRIAEDPDASLEERVAAGRVLTRVETVEGRTRVAASLADLPMDAESVAEALTGDADVATAALQRRTVGPG